MAALPLDFSVNLSIKSGILPNFGPNLVNANLSRHFNNIEMQMVASNSLLLSTNGNSSAFKVVRPTKGCSAAVAAAADVNNGNSSCIEFNFYKHCFWIVMCFACRPILSGSDRIAIRELLH